MKISKLFYEAEKIISFKKIAPFFGILIAIFCISIIVEICSPRKEKSANVELIGVVQDIDYRYKKWFFKIDNVWYLIRGQFNEYIEVGDSINKDQGSHIIKIFDKESKAKWEGDIQRAEIIEVETPYD